MPSRRASLGSRSSQDEGNRETKPAVAHKVAPRGGALSRGLFYPAEPPIAVKSATVPKG